MLSRWFGPFQDGPGHPAPASGSPCLGAPADPAFWQSKPRAFAVPYGNLFMPAGSGAHALLVAVAPGAGVSPQPAAGLLASVPQQPADAASFINCLYAYHRLPGAA